MVDKEKNEFANDYSKYGFVTDIETETIPPGLSEDTVRLISKKKNEPEWMTDWRLKSFRHWLKSRYRHWHLSWKGLCLPSSRRGR